ncbi:hypothetical protein [Sediminibacterium salmoneum]|uniref:hypothetical protein n=1 Tax=Sediminibacterium salmoneum TaxID=426421 RepID=UPI00047AD665|nr:hypothetical protein [Sediminibacterium salmoneum]
MDEITQLKRIDDVFSIIVKNVFSISSDELVNRLEKSKKYYEDLHYLQINQIIEKLEKDGNIESVKTEVKGFDGKHIKEQWNFTASLQGKNFYARGGYLGEFERQSLDDDMKYRLEQSQLQIKYLTYVIAGGTLVAAIYYTIEILKYFCVLPKTF